MKFKFDYWVPFCFASRDEVLVCLDMLATELCSFGMFDSMLYLDKMPNGKSARKCTDEEIRDQIDYYTDVARYFGHPTHPENDCFEEDELPLLSVNCPHCGDNFMFDELEDIPKEDFVCHTCQKTLIHYYGQSVPETHRGVEKKMDRIKAIFDKMCEEYYVPPKEEEEDSEDSADDK